MAASQIIHRENGSLRRASASAINKVDVAPYQSLTLSGINKRFPVVYGEVRTSGTYLVKPVIHSTNLVFAIVWSYGECEGVQDTYINGAAVPGTGVTITHYDGSAGQTPDATLVAAISGFDDAYEGIAYSVFHIEPTAAIDGYPRVEVVFRGRKVYDPRDATTAFSKNFSLFIRDFVTNAEYGMGSGITGVEECADRNDSDYLGSVRCEGGFTLAEGITAEAALDVMSTYAECLYTFDGENVKLVPDAPVTAPDAVLTLADILDGSLSMSARAAADTPTTVVINYMPPSGDGSPWISTPAVISLPGVYVGELDSIESVINLPGAQREIEAVQKGISRLNRLQYPGQYSWQAFDKAIRYQKGDVVQLPDAWGLSQQWVRIMDVQMVDLGRYQISAEHYDAQMYSADSVEGAESPVHVGLIIPYSGALPSGWADYADANGKYILAAGGTYDVGDTGGSSTAGPWSGSTSSDDIHDGKTGDQAPFGFVALDVGTNVETIGVPPTPIMHSHAVEIASFTPDVSRRAVKLMKKTGVDGEALPVNSMIFGKDNIYAAGLSRIVEFNNRMLYASTTTENQGAAIALASKAAIAFYTDTHTHVGTGGPGHDSTGSGFSFTSSGGSGSGGDHIHEIPGNLAADLKRFQLAAYGGSVPYGIKPGMIAFWDGALADIPANWYLCDGTNGTQNFTDRYVQLSGETTKPPAGNNSLKFNGPITKAGHAHVYPVTSSTAPGSTYHTTLYHDHTLNIEIAWTPPFFALAVIQYLPE